MRPGDLLHDRLKEISHLLDDLSNVGIQLDGSIFDEDSIDYVIKDLKSNIDLLHELVPTLDDIAASLGCQDDVASYPSIKEELGLPRPALLLQEDQGQVSIFGSMFSRATWDSKLGKAQ